MLVIWVKGNAKVNIRHGKKKSDDWKIASAVTDMMDIQRIQVIVTTVSVTLT